MIDSDLQGSQITLFCCHPNIRYITFVDAVNVKTLVKISVQLPFLTVDHYQGQAKGHGRITNFLPLPLVGHHFQRTTVTQWLD